MKQVQDKKEPLLDHWLYSFQLAWCSLEDDPQCVPDEYLWEVQEFASHLPDWSPEGAQAMLYPGNELPPVKDRRDYVQDLLKLPPKEVGQWLVENLYYNLLDRDPNFGPQPSLP